jgi:indole-3-glycerol phosphate synthase
MPDFLAKLIDDARRRVRDGYYDVKEECSHKPISLKRAIKSAERNAIIAEIKPASPTLGSLRAEIDPIRTAKRMLDGGAIALSVLTEPDNFAGSLENLRKVRDHVPLPLLMKDIIIHEKQVEAARKTGADSILLIEPIFSKYPISSLARMIRLAHESRLEVLLEVHHEDELKRALNSEADLVGLNNRDLSTLETNLETTIQLMTETRGRTEKVLISESGFESAEDIRRVKPARVDGFLIGSSIMLADDLERKVREFVLA